MESGCDLRLPSVSNEAATDDISQQIRTCEAEITQHEVQISSLRQRICDLKSNFNSKLPISRLHSELLAQVFIEFVSLWVHRIEDEDGWQRPSFHWSPLLRVCRGWRNVALQTPQLWTTFDLGYPATFVARSLELSGILPLHVHGSLVTPIDDATIPSFEAVLRQMARVSSLAFMSSPSLQSLLRQPWWRHINASQLATLYLRSAEGTDDFRPFPYIPLPKLTTLSIRGGSFNAVKSLARAGITNLELSEYPELPLAAFLQVISRLPALVRLSIHTVCETTNSILSTSDASLVAPEGLQSLTYLSINNKSTLSAISILQTLRIPAQTNVQLFGDRAIWMEHVTDLVRCVEERIFRSLTMPGNRYAGETSRVRSLQLHCSRFKWGPRSRKIERIRFDFAIWTTDVPEETLRHDGCAEDAKFDFHVHIVDHLADVLVDRLLLQAGLHAVTAMSLNCNSYLIQGRSWTLLFRAMPILRFLCLEGIATREFVRYHESTARSSLLLYPSLKRLKLASTRFSASCHRPRAGDLLPRLIATLTTLRDEGLRLDKLELEYPRNLADGGLNKLRATQCAKVVEICKNGDEFDTDDDDDFGRSEDGYDDAYSEW